MKLAIFAKKRQTFDEGANGNQVARDFYTYLTTLVRKSDGERVPVQVKFRQKCGAPDPDNCPMFIEVSREKANLSWEHYENKDGEELTAGKMWVTEWRPAGEYVDRSLDDFDAMV